jgi:hypothetical protein
MRSFGLLAQIRGMGGMAEVVLAGVKSVLFGAAVL